MFTERSKIEREKQAAMKKAEKDEKSNIEFDSDIDILRLQTMDNSALNIQHDENLKKKVLVVSKVNQKD